MAQSWLQQPLLRMKSSWRRADEAPTYAELSALWHGERVTNRRYRAALDQHHAAPNPYAAGIGTCSLCGEVVE